MDDDIIVYGDLQLLLCKLKSTNFVFIFGSCSSSTMKLICGRFENMSNIESFLFSHKSKYNYF